MFSTSWGWWYKNSDGGYLNSLELLGGVWILNSRSQLKASVLIWFPSLDLLCGAGNPCESVILNSWDHWTDLCAGNLCESQTPIWFPSLDLLCGAGNPFKFLTKKKIAESYTHPKVHKHLIWHDLHFLFFFPSIFFIWHLLYNDRILISRVFCVLALSLDQVLATHSITILHKGTWG